MGRAGEQPAAIPGAPPRPSAADDAMVATAVAAVAATSATATRTPSRSTPGRIKVKPDSLLATRAKDEYVYVGQDLRHIAVVAASLFGVLIVLWLFFTIVDPFGLY
jgi:hypothetical protein